MVPGIKLPAVITSIQIDGEPVTTVGVDSLNGKPEEINLKFNNQTEVVIEHSPETGVVPLLHNLSPEQTSGDFRIIEERYGKEVIHIVVEGRAGGNGYFWIFSEEETPPEVRGAIIQGIDNGLYRVAVMMGQGRGYVRKSIEIRPGD